ncbi:MAG: HNH endonuclease signature motif containing protein [Actinomycetes bacterium]
MLGGASLPLDEGRAQRLFTPAQKLALALRDGGCSFPGCELPPGDCDAHHVAPWLSGGSTDLSNGVLLCPHHHHLVEPNPNGPPDRQWLIDFDPNGKPTFAAPAGATGVRVTRQHARFRA